MLSRHFLRSKVLQTVYAVHADPVELSVAEKNYKHNIYRLNDLGTKQVSALVHFAEVAGVMIDEAQHKYLPTEAERNPNRRLPNNVFLNKLAESFRFSDPVSSDALIDIEANLSALVDELQSAVLEKDTEAAKTLCAKVEATLADRNRLCKLNK